MEDETLVGPLPKRPKKPRPKKPGPKKPKKPKKPGPKKPKPSKPRPSKPKKPKPKNPKPKNPKPKKPKPKNPKPKNPKPTEPKPTKPAPRPSGPQAALLALQRFGLGPKPGVLERIAADPLGALEAEMRTAGIADITDPTLPGYAAAARTATVYAPAEALFKREMAARMDKHLQVEVGFVERLVMFWSNHFSMSVNKKEAILGTVGQLEREVIRRHVFGNFTDMLLGVIMHPAMLAFLDNADSIGEHSEAASWWNRGHNENLAREVMELYTVGSGGGYTEKDVDALSRILTGWSYVRSWEADGGYDGGNDGNRGQFIFRPRWHEPGPITFMGKVYPDTGVSQGVAVLRRLAASPRTAENVAFKLVRHFISDTPAPADVQRLADVFIATGGDLGAVSRALVQLPSAFATPMNRIRTPYESVTAQFRAMGKRYVDATYWCYWGALDALGNLPFECDSPEGYPDESAYWLNPDAMTIRLDTALLFAWNYAWVQPEHPVKLAERLLGPALSAETRTAILSAYDVHRALAMLFVSPELQRR